MVPRRRTVEEKKLKEESNISVPKHHDTDSESSCQAKYNKLVTFDGQTYLARFKEDPEAFIWIGFFSICLVICLFLLYSCLFHFPTFHFFLSHAYARLGHPHAQHIVGQRLLNGEGVEKNEELAMFWFRQAADQGHPEAAYNLAIGHLTGLRTDVRQGEVYDLIKHAHDNGIEEAADVYHNACKNGYCS